MRRAYSKKPKVSQPIYYYKLNGNYYEEVRGVEGYQLRENATWVADPADSNRLVNKVISGALPAGKTQGLQYFRVTDSGDNDFEKALKWVWDTIDSNQVVLSKMGNSVIGCRIEFMFYILQDTSDTTCHSLIMTMNTNNTAYRGFMILYEKQNANTFPLVFKLCYNTYILQNGQTMADGYINRFQWYKCSLDLRNQVGNNMVRFKIIDTLNTTIIDTGQWTQNLPDAFQRGTAIVIGNDWNNYFRPDMLLKEVKVFKAEDLNDFLE